MSAVLSFQSKENPAPRGKSQMTTPQLIEAAQDVLLQGLGLLFELSDRTYSHVARAPFNASIGQHFRHVLEHFQCLIRGLRSKEINYDARERNTMIESEVVYSSVATCDVLRAIKGWHDRTLNAACKVHSSVSYSAAPAGMVDSNVARELSYCVAHAIHHYAIIRLICSELGISVPAEFGYAPSTVRHMSTLAAD
jgi:uncharacterized damage-inducible protein DinB